jgi:hypothetical protein
LVAKHYIDQLIQRKENSIGSHHPWKGKIKAGLGRTAKERPLPVIGNLLLLKSC